MSGAGFVNLHNHSHYSILDGYSRPVEYLKQAAALGQTALALTDHGNLFGAFEFVSTARAMSKSLDKKKHPQEPVWVKPIVGIEAYMAPENPEGAKCKRPVFYSDDPSKRSIDVSSNGAYTHLTLLAVDDAGFHNLIRLSTESFKRENTYYNQRMDMSMLAKWNTGLVATTGCPSGEIQTRLRLGQVKEAYEYAERMSDLFPGRYYVEIMSHAMKKDLERDAIPQLLKLAEDLKLPLLATNDAHYATPGDARRHEEMLCINTNSRGGAGERVYMDTPTEDTVDEWMEAHQKEAQDYLSRGRRVPTRFAFSGNDYYLKSYEEMIRQFPEDEFPGAVRNTLEVADMVGDWWAKKPLDLEAIADKYRDDVELAKAGKAFDADYRLPHAGGGVSVGGPVKANKGVTVLGETPSQPAEFKSDPLTQKLIDDGTVALGPYDLSLNKGIRPVIQIPEGWTEDQWFRKKLNDGFVQRRVAKGDSPEILAESKRRLDVEYPVFEGNDFVQYMLVVADYIGWAREHGVTVGSGRGCFLPGTRVKGKQGVMRRIEDYAPGDVVQTHDTSYHEVEKVFEYDVEDEDCVEVRSTNGVTIRCTADHMLFAKDKGFTQAQELESGSVLLGPVGRKEQFTIECMNKGCHNKITLRKQDYDVRLNKEYASKKGEVWCWDCVKHNVHNVPAVQAGSIKGALRNKDADVKAKNAASIHAHWNDPVARAAHLAKIEDWKNSEKFQEFRRHCSERNRRRYSDDAELDKLLRQGHGNYKSGWFTSYQQDGLRIYYASSYELKALNILETDSNVASFDRFDGRISYVAPSDSREHWYLPDFRVDYADGRKVIIEVKAKWQEKEPDTQAKLQAGEKWCQDNGFDFEVWDEDALASKNDAWHREYVVESVAHFRYTGKVYDLQVEGVHNYNVQGVTVHNSVGGSEVAYLMDISRTDPIRHDLLFERFLNPERKSPPDVDTDFKASVRNDVLQYAKDKYGYSNVANIVNFGTFKLKQAFQDIAKIYHADSAQAIKMSKMIPDPIDHGEPTMEDLYDPASPFYPLAGDFREAIEAGGEQWKPIREAAGALVGRVRQTGTHACGVIMCSEPIVNYAPLFWNKNEERAKENIWTDCMCQWKYQDLEAIGLIKMDFLPLSTLDIVDSVIDNVEQYNEQIDVAASAASGAGDAERAAEYRKRKLEVPDFTDIENDGMGDQETYAMLARGESDAVFQMGSDGQKDLLKRIRPTEFSDLVAINALYRPGPMAMNAHLQYADRKNGKEPCYVINEELDKVFKGTPMEDILRPTYGLCVPGDEKVLDATTGLHVPIRDFEVGHKTKSWNEETGEWSANVVSDLVHTGTKDCVELTVSNHRKVRVSKTHPLLTPRGWVAAGDLTVGDELAMNDVAMPEIEDKSGLTPDLAWFVGVMLGDGTIPGSKGYPYVTTTDQVIIDELARIAEENFGNIEVTGTKPEDAGGVNGNVYHVMFTNADRRPVGKHDRHAVGYCGDRNTVNQFLARYGYKGKIRMYDKVVTPEVMRGSNEIIRNVVAGMWDTDGTCSKTGLHYTTTSRGLYEGMCQMLDRLGVRVRVSEAPYHNEKRADRVAYRVYPNAEAFRREIVDRLRLKKTAFLSNCVMDHEPAKSMERRPSRFQQEVIEAARELVGNDPSMLSGVDVTDPRIAKNLSLRTLWSAFTGRSFKEYPAKTIAFKQLANSVKNLLPRSLQAKLDTPWRQITAIRSIGEMDCYDITVENDHTFLLNGVISHNCVYQEQIMQISQAMAGYTKGEADSLRKAMGHKVKSEMIANHKMFVDGAMKTAKEKAYRYTKEDVEKLWDIIDQFSAYAFNKCLLYSTKVLLPDNSKITLRDLHKRWQAGDHEIEIMSMWPDGQIRPNKIVNVERMPEKLMTYTVTVEIPKRYRDRKRSFTTRQITMTSNHRMLTTDGYHTIDDGGIHVGSILINDPLWRSRDTAKRNAIRRDTARKSIGAYARSEEGREMARAWLTRYQAGLTFEDRSAHQKAVQRLHPDRTDASVKAMYEAHAKANQEGRSFGYGIMTPLSDGRLCDSINEAMAGEYLLSRGVDFQLHKSLRNDRGQLKFCDFYADGLYFEMDGMGRGEQYFRDNKYGDDVPFVYMTPGDYKDKIDEALMNHHIENGVEVISIEPYHKTEVYDVEMADSGPSNFIANGLVSHNSHSVSYAINAYETAYLKCHYKPFFWAANLTQNMKNKDKFRKFLRSARDMGLKVESVDANRSGVGVTAAFDPGKAATDTITFGFDTASGVNETVAREIVASRNKNGGSFKSFDDFMTHGPESILSAGAITGLADAGAFDCLGVMRKQVADRARWIVDFYKKKRSAVASSSRGLLGMLGGSGAKSTEKSMGEYDLTRDEYSKKDGTISFGPLSYDWATMLAKEKASLGVYASADPLSNAGYGLEVMKKNPSSPYRAISTLEEEARTAQDNAGSSDGSNGSNGGGWRRKATTVRLIGYLVDLVVKRNAKGSVWFSGSVCDESGSIEFRMYSRAIQQRMEETGIGDPKTVISEDTVYDMMCSWSADTGRLTIDAVSEVPVAKADGAVPIIIRMKGEGSLRSAKWRDVAALLSAHPGNVPVAVDLAQASGKVELDGRPARRGVNMLGARVDGSSEFMDGLTALVGDRLCSWSSRGRWDPEY